MFMKKVALPFMVQLSVPSPFVFILSHFSLLLLFFPFVFLLSCCIFLYYCSFVPQLLHPIRYSVEFLNPPLWGPPSSCCVADMMGLPLMVFPGQFPTLLDPHLPTSEIMPLFHCSTFSRIFLRNSVWVVHFLSPVCPKRSLFCTHTWMIVWLSMTLEVENHFPIEYWRH